MRHRLEEAFLTQQILARLRLFLGFSGAIDTAH